MSVRDLTPRTTANGPRVVDLQNQGMNRGTHVVLGEAIDSVQRRAEVPNADTRRVGASLRVDRPVGMSHFFSGSEVWTDRL
jgi:hypothetical protein